MGKTTGRVASEVRHQQRRKAAKPAEEHTGTEVVSDENGFTVDVRSFERITTGHEAVEKAGFDPVVWKVVRCEATSWEVAVREADDSISTKPLWRVAVKCVRRIPEQYERATEGLAKRLPRLKFPAVRRTAVKGASHALVIGMADIHFGKACIDADYRLQVAEQLFTRMVDEHLRRCEHVNLSRIYVVNLGDLLHADSALLTTTKGTHQESTASFHEIYESAVVSLIRAVERCRQVAPVTLTYCSGNHDWNSGAHAVSCLKQVFAGAKDVEVDNGPASRKYLTFGKNLIGFSHGNNEAPGSYPGLMIAERPREFAESTTRMFLKGHFHTRSAKRTAFKVSSSDASEVGGCVVYTLPSPAGTDNFHDIHGYVGNKRCSQSFLLHSEFGLQSIHEVGVQEILQGG